MRRMMIAVAILAVIFGLLVLAHREAMRQINLVESEHYRHRAQEETDPARKAEYAELAAEFDRLRRYYERGQ
jgi:hypothetical protein